MILGFGVPGESRVPRVTVPLPGRDSIEGSGGEIETIRLDVGVGETGSENDFFFESVEYNLCVVLFTGSIGGEVRLGKKKNKSSKPKHVLL